MILPDGMTEEEFVAVVGRIARVLAPQFRLANEDVDDLGQQCIVWCLEALPKYRPEVGKAASGLSGFLFMACRNRCKNRLRDSCSRNDPPCKVCADAADGRGKGHESGVECKAYRRWRERNGRKSSLNRPRGLAVIMGVAEPHTSPDEVVENAETAELLALIDEHLPLELRADYLRMRAGVQVPLLRRRQVDEAILGILLQAGITVEDIGYVLE